MRLPRVIQVGCQCDCKCPCKRETEGAFTQIYREDKGRQPNDRTRNPGMLRQPSEAERGKEQIPLYTPWRDCCLDGFQAPTL